MWHDIWPSMVTNTRNLCSAFNPSTVHTHSSEYTHTQWTQWTHTHTHCEHTHTHTHTHTRSSGQPFMLWRPGSSWGFGALLKGGGWRERCTFTPPPPPTIPVGPRLKPTTFELRVLLSNIRPRLPPDLRRLPVSLSLSDGFTWFYLIVFF